MGSQKLTFTFKQANMGLASVPIHAHFIINEWITQCRKMTFTQNVCNVNQKCIKLKKIYIYIENLSNEGITLNLTYY